MNSFSQPNRTRSFFDSDSEPVQNRPPTPLPRSIFFLVCRDGHLRPLPLSTSKSQNGSKSLNESKSPNEQNYESMPSNEEDVQRLREYRQRPKHDIIQIKSKSLANFKFPNISRLESDEHFRSDVGLSGTNQGLDNMGDTFQGWKWIQSFRQVSSNGKIYQFNRKKQIEEQLETSKEQIDIFEDHKDQLYGLNSNRDQPVRSEWNKDQPGGFKCNRDQPGGLEWNRDQPGRSEWNRDQPVRPEWN